MENPINKPENIKSDNVNFSTGMFIDGAQIHKGYIIDLLTLSSNYYLPTSYNMEEAMQQKLNLDYKYNISFDLNDSDFAFIYNGKEWTRIRLSDFKAYKDIPNKNKLELNHIYIIRGNKASNSRSVRKILVIEITEKTIVTQNLDIESRPQYRELIEDFHYDWKILEDLGLQII